jgi:thioesterase domain-containing protein
MGAVVAFEMARVLRQQGEEVEQLVFIEPCPTSYAQGTRIEDEAVLEALFTANLAQMVGPPEALPAEELRRLQRVFTGNARALYQHALRPLPLPLTLLRGQEAEVGEPEAPDRGWAELVERVDMTQVPGDHYSALRAPHVATLARTLARVLESPPRGLEAVREKAG